MSVVLILNSICGTFRYVIQRWRKLLKNSCWTILVWETPRCHVFNQLDAKLKPDDTLHIFLCFEKTKKVLIWISFSAVSYKISVTVPPPSTCAAFGQEEIVESSSFPWFRWIYLCTVFSFLLYDDLIWEVHEGRWLFERLALKDIGMLLPQFQRVVCLLKSVNISVSEKFCLAYLNAEQLGLR